MERLRTTLLTLLVSVSMQAQNASVPIDENHFPDPGFRQWLSQNFQPEEIPTVTDLSIVYNGGFYDPAEAIRSLEGIEYFESLEKVRLVRLPNVHTFDFSKNIGLVSFYSDDLVFSEIDFSGCHELAYVTIHGYTSQSLSFMSNQKLRILTVLGGGLKSLDMSANSELTGLSLINCSNLEILDLSKNTALENLYIFGSGLYSLDLSENVALKMAEISYNNFLSSLLFSQNMNSLGNSETVDLERIRVYDAAVAISHNPSLETEALDAFVNSLPAVDMPTVMDATDTSISFGSLRKAVDKGWIVFFSYEGQSYDTYNNPDIISSVKSPVANCVQPVSYDLWGRQVKYRPNMGVYIQNGHKYLIK